MNRVSKNCRFILSVLLISSAPFPNVFGCATDLTQLKTPQPENAWTKYWSAHHLVKKQNSKIARKPSSELTSWSVDRPWGGLDSTAWRPEAVVANAASEALDRGFAQKGVQDVLVSVPVKMLYGNVRPYGDGQTNAAISFGTYNGKVPPLVTSLLNFYDGTKVLNLRFSHIDGFTPNGEVTLDLGNGAKPVSLGMARTLQNGGFEINWTATQIKWGDLYQNHVAYLQLPGVSGSFPVDFRDTVRSSSELLANVPKQNRNLSKGTLLDPEQVSSQPVNGTTDGTLTSFTKMYPNNPNPSCPPNGCPAGPNDFGGDLHATRFSPIKGVHNQFTYADGSKGITAVGNGDTTLILSPNAPFKMAYICFDGRNLDGETQLGVPSGGGWHEIGDHAETVMNTLENAAPLFGYANGKPGDNREYTYGLSDVTVIRKLRPGMALVTAAGTTTTAEDATFNHEARGTGPANGRNYHWFAFEQPTEVCAVEWVHPCIPNVSNNIGLSCSQ